MKITRKQIGQMGGVVAALAIVASIILAGGNVTISQGGTPSQYLDYMCNGQVKSIIITASYVRVHDCEIVGSTSHGIRVGGDGKDVHDVIIENNVVRNSITENGVYPSCGSNSWGSGIKVAWGAHNVIVRGNKVHDTCGEGIAATRAPSVMIENNVAYNNWAGNIYTDASQETIITGNSVDCEAVTVSGRQSFGIMAGHEYYAGWTGSRNGVQILNNTVSGCSDGINIFGPEAGAVNTTFSNAIIDSNTVVKGGRYAIHISSSVVTSNVRISNNRSYILPTGKLSGVTLSNNVIYTGPVVTPATSTPGAATNTPVVVSTATRTLIPVTITPTFPSPATATPTRTPTATRTLVPSTVTPTSTETPLVPPVVLWQCTVSPTKIDCQVVP